MTDAPFKKDKIWIVSHRDLVGWLEAQHENPIDPEYARTRLLPPPDAGRGWRSGFRSRPYVRDTRFAGF